MVQDLLITNRLQIPAAELQWCFQGLLGLEGRRAKELT